MVYPLQVQGTPVFNGTKTRHYGNQHKIEDAELQQIHSDGETPLSSKSSYKRFGVSFALFEEWKKDMSKIVVEGVGALMDLSISLEKMVSHEKRLQEDQHIPLLHRASVVGLFLRRIILCFDKLNFSEVSHLYHNFKQYVQGKQYKAE